MATSSRAGATFATFTAAGEVKRGLAASGFEVSKRPGFGNKRDALCGEIHTPHKAAPAVTPWDLNFSNTMPDHVLILGAGLAGAHAAFALASRGIPVTVLEAGSLANGGSSNLQGVTYTRLSHQHNPLTDFSLAAFGFATDHYDKLLHEGKLNEGEDIGLGGYIQLHDADETLTHLARVLPLAPEFARLLDTEALAALTGLQPRCGGIHYLRGGWLNPMAVCQALLAHPLISLRTHCGQMSLQRTSSGKWQAVDQHGSVQGRSKYRRSGYRTGGAATGGAVLGCRLPAFGVRLRTYLPRPSWRACRSLCAIRVICRQHGVGSTSSGPVLVRVISG